MIGSKIYKRNQLVQNVSHGYHGFRSNHLREEKIRYIQWSQINNIFVPKLKLLFLSYKKKRLFLFYEDDFKHIFFFHFHKKNTAFKKHIYIEYIKNYTINEWNFYSKFTLYLYKNKIKIFHKNLLTILFSF